MFQISIFIYLGKTWLPPPLGGASPNGLMEFYQSSVVVNCPLADDIFLQEGWVVERIKMTASPGFNRWPICRQYLLWREELLSHLVLKDGDRIHTFGHLLYCNLRRVVILKWSQVHLWRVYVCIDIYTWSMYSQELNRADTPFLWCNVILPEWECLKHNSLYLVTSIWKKCSNTF